MKTSLYDKHVKLGAKMVPFAGYDMPVNYAEGIQQEYAAVRKTAGVFDVSHMGEFFVSGGNALAFLQNLTLNDVSKLSVGDAQYTAMCLPDGGIVDDMLIYRRPNDFMAVVNAANIKKDFDWIKDHLMKDVILTDESLQYSLIALQGPVSRKVLEDIFNFKIELGFYTFKEITFQDQTMLLSRTGYTGELGFEIYCDHESAQTIWDRILDSGKVKPAGLAARDILRMEMKYCLYGNDISAKTNPVEAGLSWITALDKGDFIGRETILKVKENKPERRLITFKLNERGIPRQGYEIQINGENVGVVTSGTQSPGLQCGIGLGYVRSGQHQSGTAIDIIIRNKPVSAIIVKPPFIKQTSLMF